MPTKKSQWTQKILKSAKNDKKNVKKTPKKTEKNGKSDLQKNIKLANEDRCGLCGPFETLKRGQNAWKGGKICR